LFLRLGWDIYNYSLLSLTFFMVFSRHNPSMQPLAQMLYHNSVTSSAPHSPTLLVHGGAWAIPADAAAAHQAGVRQALEAGYALLSRGASALDAVEAAVTVLEDDPTFDAGCGSFLTSDGRVQLDALLMDGGRMKAGGVACVERLRNPIQAARLVLEQSQHVYFVGPGAENFAQAHGMTLIDNSELVLDRERERLVHAKLRESAGLGDDTFSGQDFPLHPVLHDDKSPETAFPRNKSRMDSADSMTHAEGLRPSGQDHAEGRSPSAKDHDTVGAVALDAGAPGPSHLGTGESSNPTSSSRQDSHDTVGAVALDSSGNLAAATSTGGTLNKTPGRVGDSSLIGCGCYADNLSAAVSLTGWGEPIMKLVLGKWATDRVAFGTAPDIAAREAIAYLFNRLGGHGGIILLGPDGRFGLAYNTPAMAWGLATNAGLQTGLSV
jgi:beta-aspartyl-peptidase (threonine type)